MRNRSVLRGYIKRSNLRMSSATKPIQTIHLEDKDYTHYTTPHTNIHIHPQKDLNEVYAPEYTCIEYKGIYEYIYFAEYSEKSN